jgi:hypothetical protein
MIGFVIDLTYNLTNPFLMLIIELMQCITIYFKGPFADVHRASVGLREPFQERGLLCLCKSSHSRQVVVPFASTHPFAPTSGLS